MTASNEPAPTQRVAITGSGGLVGAALTKRLAEAGTHVVRLVRHPPTAHNTDKRITECQWSTTDGVIEPEKIEGLDAIVNLAGESIAGGRWTKPRRTRIVDSRVMGTEHLISSLATLKAPPQVLVNASAVGYYGDRGSQRLTEDAAAGTGFLSSVCTQWEQAAGAVSKLGTRVVLARFGIVLSKQGGALSKMLTPFRLGLGGRIGNGHQYMSWIALEDVVEGIRFAIHHDQLQGPANFTAPEPVTNRTFTRALGAALQRPTFIPVPRTALRIAFGQMADELLLPSTRAFPAQLVDHGYDFKFPTIDSALASIING